MDDGGYAETGSGVVETEPALDRDDVGRARERRGCGLARRRGRPIAAKKCSSPGGETTQRSTSSSSLSFTILRGGHRSRGSAPCRP